MELSDLNPGLTFHQLCVKKERIEQQLTSLLSIPTRGFPVKDLEEYNQIVMEAGRLLTSINRELARRHIRSIRDEMSTMKPHKGEHTRELDSD